jgi:type IV fimbrial biogenesis protein FimT
MQLGNPNLGARGTGTAGVRGSRMSAPDIRGFTLTELMVVIGVLAILLAIAAPSFTGVINSNRLATQANEVVASLQLARSEAIRRNARVIVCRSIDGTACVTASGQGEWITFIDADGSGTAQAAEILRVSSISPPVLVSNLVDRITFRPNGVATDAAGALLATTITVCLPTTQPADNQRAVNLASGSRVSTEAVNGAGACP